MGKRQNSAILHHSAILEDIKDGLCKKYTTLNVNPSISQDHVPFLHIWKPIRKSEGVQGMPFLPCFHIIVTLTGDEDDKNDSVKANNSDDVLVLFQLHSFHGKVIADESIALKDCNQYANYDLVRRMAEDRIQVCHGIEEVNKDRFTNFLASSELPLLGKIKSVFLIEQFMGEIVLRSRLCEFALYDGTYQGPSTMENFPRCQECEAFQMDHGSNTIVKTNFISDQMQSLVADEKLQIHAEDMFDRVCQQTTVSDGEAMAVFDQATKFYDVLNSNSKRSKRRDRKTNFNQLELKSDKDIKVEPSEALHDGSVLEYQQNTNENVSSGDSSFTDPKSRAVDNIQQYDENIERTSKESTEANLLEDYECKSEDGVRDIVPANSTKKRRKRVKNYMYDLCSLPDISERSRRKYRKKELTEEQKLAKIEKLAKRKIEAKKRLVTYSRTCSICSHTFTNITHFDQDQSRHAQALADLGQPFCCPVCNVTIESKYLVTEHFAKDHAELNATCCCECSQVIPNGNNRLRRHILKFHHSAEEKVVCPECGKESSGRTQLEIHLAQYHSDKKIAVCQTCGKGFGTMSHYQLHLRRHHQPRDLQCPHCDKKFESRDQAIKHLIVHTGIKPFKCIQCQYVSYRASNVYCVHYEKSHGRKGNNDDVITDIVERDRMFEIARVEAEAMLQERNSKLKKEPRSDSIFMRTWGRKISTTPENPVQ